MTFSHHFRQRLTACVAIVAVLLLFVAPIVSKTLLERHSRMMDTSSQAMTNGMSMQQHQLMMQSMMPGMDHHMMDEGEFACGYCDLLVHVPLMMWVFIPLLWLIWMISRAPPLPCLAAPRLRRYAGTPRPRAPPLLLSAD